MSKGMRVAAICCASLAFLGITVALVRPNWIKVCIPYKDIASFLLSTVQSNSKTSSLASSTSKFIGDSDVCYLLGLFKLTVYFPSLKYQTSSSFRISIDKLPSYIQAAEVCLIMGLLVLLPAIVVIGMNVCSASSNEEKKRAAKKYGIIGTILLVISVILFGSGMFVYTISQSEAIHHPQEFFIQIGKEINRAQFGGSKGNGMMGSLGSRKRRQAYNMFDDLDMNKLQSAEARRKIQEIVAETHPKFDYSFYVAWLGVVAALIAAILANCSFKESGKAEAVYRATL